MSTLWTPGGEHEVPRDEPTPAPGPEQTAAGPEPGPGPSSADFPDFDDLTPEQQAQAEQMARELAEARERLAQTPAAEVVANHVMGLYELGAIHLSGGAVDEAKVAIDAMVGVMDGLPGRLGEDEPVLREALQQLQMAFVQVSQAQQDEAADSP